uniref:Uncharacterized protein n=1 Tax=Ditylenchus dipsaci TaxID=166011 RepID=A0A915EHY6_9BILA
MSENKFVMPGCIGDLLAKRDELKRHVNIGELTSAAYKKNLDKVSSDLSEAKDKSRRMSDLANYLDELLANLDSRVSALSSASAEKDVMMGHLQALLNLDSSSMMAARERMKKLEQDSVNLTTACQDSPWIPEKQEFIRGYKDELAKLTHITQELGDLNSKIEDRKQIIDGHSMQPFRSFCIHDLATFHSQTRRMKALWTAEVIKKKQLEDKLAERDPSQNDLSFFLNQHEGEGHQMNTETQIDSTVHVLEPERPNLSNPMMAVTNHERNGDVVMEDVERRQSSGPVLETSVVTPVNNSVQIVDYDDSDPSTPVKKSLAVLVTHTEDNAMEQSVPEQQIEDYAERSMVEQQSQSKDQFPSQVEFSFAGDGILGAANITDDGEDNAENFFTLMNSISGGEDDQAGFFDLFGSEPKDKETGGKSGESFNFNFGNASVNDSIGFGGTGQKSFF